MIRHVAIIGAGFSGALQAINLLRHDGPRATLIERRGAVARGVAYSAAHPDHLLNVRADRMSALPDQPDHFRMWLAKQGLDADGFVPRLVYGDYLAALLAETVARDPDRLRIVQGDVIDVEQCADGVALALDDGSTITADAAVLAMGNLRPHEPAGIAAARLGADVYAPDPWRADITAGLEDGDRVLAIGTGLTMIDVALLLEANGFGGQMIAMSRRGLVPRAHGQAAPRGLSERPPLTATALLRAVRARARLIGWRSAVDELRPYTQDMWLAAEPAERARFLRHLRPWWDVHRHRLAPIVDARISALRAGGRLDVVAGTLLAAEPQGRGARVTWRPRGGDAIETMDVRRIVNCSGPQGDLARSEEPLLTRLATRGLIRPDRFRLGLDVDMQARLIGSDGTASDRLFALGPMTRGAFWEIVAVPDIRVQTWTLARKLSNAHWVGGEGL
ncbi:FAD/NAD(P)-binding protein [Sphingomonas sp. 1P06PA]|uniref:FAD/NAD(P)-binding protein n=1 Tax=Sphingomonas sp. 1P06PA TaxID=554121 RepID=UPI0039A74CA3